MPRKKKSETTETNGKTVSPKIAEAQGRLEEWKVFWKTDQAGEIRKYLQDEQKAAKVDLESVEKKDLEKVQVRLATLRDLEIWMFTRPKAELDEEIRHQKEMADKQPLIEGEFVTDKSVRELAEELADEEWVDGN